MESNEKHDLREFFSIMIFHAFIIRGNNVTSNTMGLSIEFADELLTLLNRKKKDEK